MEILTAAGAAVLLAFLVWFATRVVRRFLLRWRVLDRPNRRSSHAVPTPRGAGLALVPPLLLAWALWGAVHGPPPPGLALVLAGAVVLAGLSWLDDMRGLPAALRFAVQAAAVALGVVGLGDGGPVFQGLLPPWLDRLAAGFVWLWFVNLFNFMDGIDGITGVETLSLALGLALCLALVGGQPFALGLALLLAGATAGFLPWNWAPAKIFLGDVGAVPLGYLLGWLLLAAAGQGLWAVALILPLYYLADATLTLLKRGLRGEKVWRAHRDHAYHARRAGRASPRRRCAAGAGLQCGADRPCNVCRARHALARPGRRRSRGRCSAYQLGTPRSQGILTQEKRSGREGRSS